jgi:hypothetical protein
MLDSAFSTPLLDGFRRPPSQTGARNRIRRVLQMNPPSAAPVRALPVVLLAVSMLSAQPPAAQRCASLPQHQTWLTTQVQWIIEDRERAKAEHERCMQWAAARYPNLEPPRRLSVQFGPPDEIESHPKEGYEAWRYRSLPGKEKNYTVRFDRESR